MKKKNTVKQNSLNEKYKYLDTHYLKENYIIKNIFYGVKNLPEGYDVINNIFKII